MLADLLDTPANGQVVVAGCHDEVGPDNPTLFIHFIMVDQHAARRFNHSHTFEGIHSTSGANVGVENLRVIQKCFDAFESVDDLDEAGIMIQKCAMCGRSETLMKFGEFNVCARRAALIGYVDTR